MELENTAKANKKWAIIIGVGLALFPIHNRWLTDVTSVDGMATLFLPAFGAVIWILGTLFFLRNNSKRIDWGDKKILIPLIVIVVAMGLSGITAETWGERFAPLLMGGTMLALYLVARVLGKDMFLPLAIGAGIGSLGIIAYSIWQPGQLRGGFVFGANYDIAAGYILLGAALCIRRWQWMLAGLALFAMCLSGSPEGVFAIGVMGIVVLLRRDWDKRLVLVIIPTIVMLVIIFSLGYGQTSYQRTLQSLEVEAVMEIENIGPQSPIGVRWRFIKLAMTDIRPLGNGYNLTEFFTGIVHNVPLIIVQQLGYPGILAGLAWLWVTMHCLIKTKMRYALILVLALSVFDHYIWTQLAPWWWAIIGVSTTSNIKSDLVFNRKG